MTKILSPMILFFLIGFQAQASEACFQRHVLESISINKKRKAVYSNLTDGSSNKIFNALIASEKLTLPIARYFDLRARPFHEQKINLFCEEFMSMIKTPRLELSKKIIPAGDFIDFNWSRYQRLLLTAIKAEDHKRVRKISLEGLVELKQQPKYLCFTRHFLESIYRFAYFIPKRVKQAKEKGLNDPRSLMFQVMKVHLLGFYGTYKIDQWSFPIQKAGIPILCSEIPDLLADLTHPELQELKHYGK